MVRRVEEKALQKIMPKLKEDAAHSEEFMTSLALEPIRKKIDKVINDLRGLITKKGTSLSLILNELENIRDQFDYYRNAVAQVREEYATYVYALETLYGEYSGSESKIIKNHEKKLPSNNSNLISNNMYDMILEKLKQKGITTFNTSSAETIDVSKASLKRFVKAAIERGDVVKTGKRSYGLPRVSSVESLAGENGDSGKSEFVEDLH
ncbi:MAG: hypothetical protein QXU32_07945 [Nitrososphaerales archaeon]